jgi:hypothetical protein
MVDGRPTLDASLPGAGVRQTYARRMSRMCAYGMRGRMRLQERWLLGG